MAYWLDEGWHSWPEVVRAGTAAAGLYARCGSYIADHTTDGLIPAEVARMYGTAEWVKRLLDVGLWTIEGDGYRDERYFPLNPSKSVIEKRKADAAERQRRKRTNEQTRESRVTKGVTTRVTERARAPSPPLRGGSGGVGAAKAVVAQLNGTTAPRELPRPHPFADDGTGQSCSRCRLLRINKVHAGDQKGRRT